MPEGARNAAARQRWRKLRTAAFILRLLRSRSLIGSSIARTTTLFRESFLSEYCAQRRKLLKRALAKPFWSRSDVDVKLLAELLRHCKFCSELSSASHDALACVLQIRTLHDGEVIFQQGDAIDEISERFLVIYGSLLVFSRCYETEDRPRSSKDGDDFGEWIDTCSPGTSCGEDAISGAIVRKTTVLAQGTTMVACITQADYRRIARFNVATETEVLNNIRLLFEASGIPFRLNPAVFHNRPSMRVVKRFLHRYECFRMLPQDLLVRVGQMFQVHSFQPDENVTAFYGGKPRMFIVLSGECCAHIGDTAEETNLKTSVVNQKINTEVSSNGSSNPRTGSNISTCDGLSCVCCNKADSQASGTTITTHICTLSDGDAFGGSTFLTSLLSFQRQPAENSPVFIARSRAGDCCIASITFEDFDAIRSSYLDSTPFSTSAVYSVLTSKLPRDRTCEQIHFLAVFLTRHSSAKMFFRQTPPAILRQICLHATLEKYPMGKEAMACIQEQGEQVTSFRVVLDGYLGVFKTQDHGSLQGYALSNGHVQEIVHQQKILSSGQEISRLTSSTEGVGDQQNDSDSHDNQDARQNITCAVNPSESSVKFADSFGIICPSSAFGLLQVLLKSVSPFGYLAYATTGSANTTTNLLSLAAPIARLYLRTVDEYLVYHPTRALKQAAHVRDLRVKSGLELPTTRRWQAAKEFERLVFHYPAVSGIPRTKLQAMVRRMQIVDIPAHYFLYEAGEVTKGCIFIILQGSVRTFRQIGKSKSSVRVKNGRKVMSELSRSMAENSQKAATTEEATTPERSIFGLTKRVDEDFFTRDYEYAEAFEVGDGFGRHGPVNAFQRAAPITSIDRSPSNLSLLVRRASGHRIQSRKESVMYNLYPETAITVSNCRLGILRSDSATEEMFKLDPALKDGLLESLEGPFVDADKHSKIQTKEETLILGTRYRILERMDLAKRLKTDQLIKAASALQYIEVRGGETVYRRGDEGTALYFVLSGQVRLFAGRESTASKPTPESPVTDDYWSIDASEGDVFGEEAFFTCFSSINRRLTSAVAVMIADKSARVGLVYLLLEGFVAAPVSTEWDFRKRDRSYVALNRSDRMELVKVHKRSVIERWKAAAFQVTRNQWQWNSSILNNQQHRIALTFDVVKHLPIFRDLPKWQCLEVCKYCMVQVSALDSIVFGKGDDEMEHFFLIVEGSVAIQQSCSLPLSMSGVSTASVGLDTRPVRVTIRILKPGECFGEVELLLRDSGKRLVDAVVTSARTKLLRVPKKIFSSLWPQKEVLESKLRILKQAFDAASPLGLDQLCSLYYAMRDYSFKRNDVVSEASTQRGTILVLGSGLCIVHDYVTLQRKHPHQPGRLNNRQPNNCTPQLALDTRVASLGPGAIIFTDELAKASEIGSKPSLTEYIVADSPVVGAFGVDLCPKTLATGATPNRRSQELLVFALFGRMGLQRIRTVIAAQRSRRVDSAAYAIHLAEKSAPKDNLYSILSPNSPQIKRVIAGNDPIVKVKGSPNRMELLQYLRDRQLPADFPSPSQKNICLRQPTGPVCPTRPETMAMVPSKPLGPNGSFATGMTGLFPVLTQAGQFDRYVKENAPSYVDPAAVAASMRTAQLIKETRIISELSQRSQVYNLGSQLVSAKEECQRQRHGRPPSRQAGLVNVLAPGAPHENDKKRSGLCRRLLHIKDGSHD